MRSITWGRFSRRRVGKGPSHRERLRRLRAGRVRASPQGEVGLHACAFLPQTERLLRVTEPAAQVRGGGVLPVVQECPHRAAVRVTFGEPIRSRAFRGVRHGRGMPLFSRTSPSPGEPAGSVIATSNRGEGQDPSGIPSPDPLG